MVETYNAHEQGEVVKKWLQENGSAIVMGLVIAFGGLFGFKQWQNWQESNRQQASYEYEVMGQLLAQDQLDAAMANFQVLKDDHGKSPYASMAALQMARARMVSNQPDLSIGLYEYVVENGYPKAMRVVARERLARVLLDQGQPEKALELLDGAEDISGFKARYAEVRGDILFAQGRTEEAISAYQASLDQLEAGAGDRNKLIMKLESLGAVVPAEAGES
ncbi:MAG: tetratricopeptide repeat protein [Xanthomonadales bacterium]|nr:tetratricopeptide repeat protein [Gammaproteobacteria bacterium]MBT8052137.1 tetratricopeptide repeat protein [Gammaproteobacteria bacterium]MBT8056822.1 tetratricopeptide repeat protein [Gammaproteobacteria bacterium]NNJ79472.1 tetratricopeptide repeat protein [Xanthomonadales bacterium]NNL05610.1 tetratricopeptide repeat protein [Xanthomonadales bacterium]